LRLTHSGTVEICLGQGLGDVAVTGSIDCEIIVPTRVSRCHWMGKRTYNGTRAGPPTGTKNCDCISYLVSPASTNICDVHTFNAIAAEEPVAHVMQGALKVPAVQPRVGDRNALSSKLSDPFWISGEVSIKQDICFVNKAKLTSRILVLGCICGRVLCKCFPVDQEICRVNIVALVHINHPKVPCNRASLNRGSFGSLSRRGNFEQSIRNGGVGCFEEGRCIAICKLPKDGIPVPVDASCCIST
jgi:hypothetical protein